VLLERLTTPRHILVEKAREKARKRGERELRKKRENHDNEIERRLSGAAFPIRSKGELISRLGGKGTVVGVKGEPAMPSEEIADLCFAEKRIFFTAKEVSNALDASSWARATVKSLYGIYFPLRGPGEVLLRVGNITIDGVKIEDLIGGIHFPVKSSTELIDKLVDVRKSKA
jgi:hypothetical protein